MAVAAAEQLSAIRHQRSKAFHGVPQQAPVEVRLRSSRCTDSRSASMASMKSQLEEVRAARRRNFREANNSSADSAAAPAATSDEVTAGVASADNASDATGTAIGSDASEARMMLAETNKVRLAHGCCSLAWNSRLASIAERAARRMARREVPFSHCNACERFAEYPLGSGDTYGENLARSQGIHPLACAVVQGWVGSPGHFKNLIGPFTACGIGVGTDDTGVSFVVQLFAAVPGDQNDGDESCGGAHVPSGKPFLLTGHFSSVLFVLIMVAIAYSGGWLDSIGSI
eukprot:TRINITY_DN26832_c0_g2_i1.p1 TRINITY_DN26832_c0_g2~~TRINITY_DN26832_c0_g2_i1.p1  ORF type:complete len:286 (+),score=27.77 TRINITY_DN26832_c0_g2_i1:89-946(+)